MLSTRFSLRTRFVGAILLVVILLSAGFYLAVSQFIEYLEYELLATRVQQELQELVKDYETDTEHEPHESEDIWRYIASTDADIPAPLKQVPPGIHDDVMIDGREFYVGRQDVKGSHLFVGIDMEPLERLEERLLALTVVCTVLGLVLSWLLARLLARLVTRPVDQLAALVSHADPKWHGPELAALFKNREIGVIAAAFDRYALRVKELIRREQAFTEDASHELRTPITAISGAAQLLSADQNIGPIAQRRVQRILRASVQMARLTEVLLFLARDDHATDQEECDLHQLLAEVCQINRDLLGDRPLTIGLIIEAPQRVRGQAGMIASLVGNLIANAVAHTERGRIELTLRPSRLIIEDSGTGIAEEDLARIFEHGYRGSNSRGFGLGLSLVARIADRLGWHIEVTSALGAGARFELTFPVPPPRG
ncbi:MAG: sensor histidine kinase [Hydrocarboniphaga sp.]|uniref:sensor histidine kinase n=1 Tax=Hydrocarboniphaga sp. TaxID=2033016 RepID=UPI002603A477|nr:HAMP domain-containing sensor histidine kinase [Hydrocarboniphaga sp.]MDB5972566.1 sensor histidine kinase [Hydrocarboniphaga sp.]